MAENKTQPTTVSVDEFLMSVSSQRQAEARQIIEIMKRITRKEPVMWGPSIIGFGTTHYKYDTGREGDMPQLAFSPRKSAITFYFNGGFNTFGSLLDKLGKHKTSVGCLYVNKLSDVDVSVLRRMFEESFAAGKLKDAKYTTVAEYVDQIPDEARPRFDELRALVKGLLPDRNEVLSYGLIGYKVGDKRARVYISGWKDHLGIYPVPHDEDLQDELKPYIKGKGTLWFGLDEPLPTKLITKVVKALAAS